MNIASKKIVPIVTFLMGAVWLFLGLTKYTWMDGDIPGSGFFPSIIAVLIMFTSLIALYGDFRADKVKYSLTHLYPILAVLSISLLSYVIGLTLSILVYLLYWLGIYEKYSIKMTVIFSVATTIVVYGVFVMWLKVPFPTGFVGF